MFISFCSCVLLACLDLHLLWEQAGPGGHGCLAGVGGAAGEDLLGLRPGWHSGWGGSRGRGGAAAGGAGTRGCAGARLAAAGRPERRLFLLGLRSRQAPRGAEAEFGLIAAGLTEAALTTVQLCAVSTTGGGCRSDVGCGMCPLASWL